METSKQIKIGVGVVGAIILTIGIIATKRPGEPSLVKEMEKSNIGRTSIVETPKAQATPKPLVSQKQPIASVSGVAEPQFKPVNMATPIPLVPTPNYAAIEQAARKKQYEAAIPWKNQYDYWTSEVEVLTRHKKFADAQNAKAQKENAHKQYSYYSSEQFLRVTVSKAVASEKARLEKEAYEAPLREAARKKARNDAVYDGEYDRTYNKHYN